MTRETIFCIMYQGLMKGAIFLSATMAFFILTIPPICDAFRFTTIDEKKN